MADERMEALIDWIGRSTPYGGCSLKPASADASFRRYFRISAPDGSRIVMDAPPELEPCDAFVRLSEIMGTAGLPVPKVYHQDLKLGFLILSDFGRLHYQEALLSEQRNDLYERAIHEILKMQQCLRGQAAQLPVFDRSWQAKELEIFREWCLPRLAAQEFDHFASPLISGVDEIPKSFMHRDFHCRNLMIREDGSTGIIDFQGAMLGPITYDLVSLLRDCYLENSADWVSLQVMNFRTQLIQSGLLPPEIDSETVTRWFDWSGLQRHLKCLGIFHRLKIRDGKPQYLADVPRVLGYANRVLNAYPELSDLKALLDQSALFCNDSPS